MRAKPGVIAAAVAFLALAPPADPHPGHGAIWIGVGQFKYNPAATTITVGDSVLWTWNGPDTNHSVTADADQSMTFDSDPGKPAAEIAHPLNDGYGVTFNAPGTFRYHCKVHSFMTGMITVQPAPAGTTPAQPAPPRLSRVSARPSRFCTRCSKPGTTVRYTLDAPASMRAALRRRGKTVKEIDFPSPPGPRSRRLEFKKIKDGTYVLRLVAVDNVNGTTSKPVDVAVRVRG
jgi:plastocyanin